MRIQINPVEVDGVVTDVAEVSVAVSSSVAVRVVPVVDGVPVESAGFGVVGRVGDESTDHFLAAVADAVQVLLAERGV
jgi:uncharacterized protein (UPF0210 family)